MEDTATNGDATKVVTNGVGKETELSGWIFRYIQEGWLFKRWRKRWCVVQHDKLVFYEFEPSSSEDKECGAVELEYYEKCLPASKKESKKSPHTFVLELRTSDQKTNKNKKTMKRELFYVDTEEDKEKWMQLLNDRIATAILGDAKPLDHVTKARPKPAAGQRRPPTRQHMRQRAVQSEVLIGFNLDDEVKSEPVKRGHVPSTAIKPPPPGGAKPKNVRSASALLEPTEIDYLTIENSQSAKESPKSPLKPKPQGASKNLEDASASDAAVPASKAPPPAPSKALKPKLKTHSVEEALVEEDEQDDGKLSLPSEGEDDVISKKAAPPTPSKFLKPKLQKETLAEEEGEEEKISFPSEDDVDTVNRNFAPVTPSKALKPKLEKSTEELPSEEEAEENLTLPENEDHENTITGEEEKGEPKSVSSEAEADDDTTVKTPQEDKVSKDDSPHSTEDKQDDNATAAQVMVDEIEKENTDKNEKIETDKNKTDTGAASTGLSDASNEESDGGKNHLEIDAKDKGQDAADGEADIPDKVSTKKETEGDCSGDEFLSEGESASKSMEVTSKDANQTDNDVKSDHEAADT